MKPQPGAYAEIGLTARTVQAGAWLMGRRYVAALINLGVMAILARQLTPAQFGVVALARVAMSFLVILSAGGIGDFVIYDRQPGHQERASSAFWLSLLITVACCLFAVLLIPLVVNFYGDPLLSPLILLLLLQFLFDQASVVPDALLRRALDFKRLVLRDGALHVIASVGSVVMALTGAGVWSLVIPLVAVSPFRLLLVMVLSRWLPSRSLGVSDWPRVFRYSASIVGTNIANLVSSQGDTLIVGKVLGNGPLGLYNLAWGNANLVGRNITSLLSRVTMPALSAVAADRARLVSAYYRMTRLMGMLAFPALLGLLVVAGPFVLTVYGPQWSASVLPMQILILFALRNVIGSPMSVIFKVVGRPDVALRLAAAVIPAYLLAVWIGAVAGGIVGVAVGVTVTRTLGGLVSLWVASRLIGEPVRRALTELGPPLFAALPMFVSVVGVKAGSAPLHLPPALELALLTSAGIGVYLVTLRVGFQALAAEAVSLSSSLSPRLGGVCRWLLAQA